MSYYFEVVYRRVVRNPKQEEESKNASDEDMVAGESESRHQLKCQ